MARPYTFDNSKTADYGKAGAASLFRLGEDIESNRRYDQQFARQLDQDARADEREARIAQGQELDNKIRQAELDRKLAFDEADKKRYLTNLGRAQEANKLFDTVDTKHPDAGRQLDQIIMEYGDLADEKTGDERFRRRLEFNLKNFGIHQKNREELALKEQAQLDREAAATAVRDAKKLEADTRSEEAKRLGMVPHNLGPEGMSYSNPKGDDESAAKRLTHLESLRMKPKVDADVAAYLDAEIMKLRAPAPTARPAEPTAASTPLDNKAFAQKILDDPESSVFHKDTARKVLAAATENQNQAAVDWANANPNDPRAVAIKQKLGIK